MSQKRRPLRPKRPLVALKRPVRSPGAREPRSRGLVWLALLPMAFFLGRITSPAPPPIEPPVETPPLQDPEPVAAAATSTAACCPCPPPKTKAPIHAPIAGKKVPPQAVTEPERDPTEATAQYVRNSAGLFGECAPKTGAGLRVHLEITVKPSGAIERSRVANLDPLPEEVSGCVRRVLDTLKPPGFEGASPETFALTVVL